MNDLGTTLSDLWSGFIGLLEKVVVPDWGALVALIPIFIVPLVLLYLAATGGIWTLYAILRPRPKVRYDFARVPATLDDSGTPLFPPGEPFSPATRLIYPPGTVRGDAGEDLSVICPMCRVERNAQIARCANCGLVLKVERPLRISGPSAPPPGGAAIA